MKEGDMGKRVYRRRTELGLTMAELAVKTGYKSRSSIQKIEKDGRGVPQDKILLLAQALKVSPAFLMGWTDDPDHWAPTDLQNIPGVVPLVRRKIPVLGNVHCGTPTYVKQEYLGPADAYLDVNFAIYAEGNSMIGAGIHAGDLLLIRKQSEVKNGQIAVILKDDTVVVKRVHKTPDAIILSAENPDYAPIVFPANMKHDIKILGKVVANLHYFEGNSESGVVTESIDL